MLIATLVLILFGGGTFDLNFIEDMKKGVKEFVVDSERQKDILVDVKSTKKLITNFNKSRKSQFKTFKKMNANRGANSADFHDFFTNLEQERKQHYQQLASARIGLANKITADEWQVIMQKSAEAIEKRQQKAQKKADKAEAKGKGYFPRTRKAIIASIADEDNQQRLTLQLGAFNTGLQKLQQGIKATNVKENEVLHSQDATEADILQLSNEMSMLRQSGFTALLDFHMLVKEYTDEAAWEKIMKQFNKEFSLTSV